MIGDINLISYSTYIYCKKWIFLAAVDYFNNGLISDVHFLERRLRSSPWERNFLFPLCFLTLLAMTIMALLLVTANTLQLLYYRASVISVQVSIVICNQPLCALLFTHIKAIDK